MSLREVTIKIVAGGSDEFAFKGNYLRAKTAPYTVSIENIESGGRDVFSLQEGEDALFTDEFERLRVTNTGAADAYFTFIIGKDAKVSSAKVSGSVIITSGSLQITAQMPPQAIGANTQKTVTNASASMVAANAARQYLLIQNKDTAGVIYINFGAAATVANGLKIAAGGSFELNSNMLTGQIFAIGDIASNANIVVIEG